MSNVLRICVGLLSALVLTDCGFGEDASPRPQSPEDAVAGDFTVVPCVHVANEVAYSAECGTLIVPENRYDESSSLISIPVKRIPASRDAPAEPIFHLNPEGNWSSSSSLVSREDVHFTAGDGVRLHGWYISSAGAKATLPAITAVASKLGRCD